MKERELGLHVKSTWFILTLHLGGTGCGGDTMADWGVGWFKIPAVCSIYAEVADLVFPF